LIVLDIFFIYILFIKKGLVWMFNFLSKTLFYIFLLFSGVVNSFAVDFYNANSNQLTITSVSVGNVIYNNVIINVGQVRSVGSYPPIGNQDTYDSSLNILNIPSVEVEGIIYYNVTCSVGKVLSVGNSEYSSTTNTFKTPESFGNLINEKLQNNVSLVQSSSLTNRGRYLISDSLVINGNTNFLSTSTNPIGKDVVFGTNIGYPLISTNLTSSSNVQNYLNSLIQLVVSQDGNFRFDSHINPNDAIDYDSKTNSLIFTNNFGLTSSKSNGYLTFSFDLSTHLIQTKNRYVYQLTNSINSTNSSQFQNAYTESDSLDVNFKFSNYYVKESGGIYSLVSSATEATPFYFFNSPFDFGIPKDFNPSSTPYVSNAPAPFLVKTSPSSIESSSSSQSIFSSLKSAYRNQVTVPGSDQGTKTAADSMLSTIVSTAKANNFSLRYDASLYTAYRDATLAFTLVSDSIADGIPGQHLVPFVYYTNETDSSGQYHPMMIIVHYGNQSSPNGLIDINRPPGAGGTGGYENGFVTRYSNLDNYVTAIPLRDYGTVSTVFQNKFSPSLLSDTGINPSSTNTNVYNYASTADNGLLIDGSVIFPVMNNTLVPSQSMAELSVSGCHVGQGGGGPHCHADGYQSGNQFGSALYGDLDYVGASHPPLIGFGYDGLALYGQYRSGGGYDDSKLLGGAIPLDVFGGHSHDNLGYHYHAHTVTWTNSGNTQTYTLHVLLKGAWAGNINSIPYFYKPSNFKNNIFLGGN
jgi:hypothetical protein